jgi:ATP-dependent Zn protease
MAGHVSVKLFLGEYWTGATGDFQNVRSKLWQLAHFGYFGPPIALEGYGVGQNFSDKAKDVEKLWRKLEDQTAKILGEHAPEVHAVAQALLDHDDLTGKQCIEIIQAAALEGNNTLDSQSLLKSLVEETIVNAEQEKPKKLTAKRKPKSNGNGHGS